MNLRILKCFLTVLCAFSILVCLSGCVKDRDVYAESSDFASYPDYWNDFNSSNNTTDSSQNTAGETEIITDNSSIDNSLIIDIPSDASSSQTSGNSNSSDENPVDDENPPSKDENAEETPSQSQPDYSYQGPIVFF